jgi:hypothetical protein
MNAYPYKLWKNNAVLYVVQQSIVSEHVDPNMCFYFLILIVYIRKQSDDGQA